MIPRFITPMLQMACLQRGPLLPFHVPLTPQSNRDMRADNSIHSFALAFYTNPPLPSRRALSSCGCIPPSWPKTPHQVTTLNALFFAARVPLRLFPLEPFA
ncbi:hypothetical protein LZ32DRAFT_396204 [Colletotrichum eremochloae]|nr:hypothetical protein LZ32DRAFT_396204 [Colletotrichum eremochloae]